MSSRKSYNKLKWSFVFFRRFAAHDGVIER